MEHHTIVKNTRRDYVTSHLYMGSFERVNGLESFYRVHTPAGYWDSRIQYHHWYLTDRLGSTVAVIEESGKLLQRNGYFPSGTPYLLPSDDTPIPLGGQAPTLGKATDRLHIGNRYLSHVGLNWYDNTARMHDPLLMRFTSPDPLASKYPGLSPWAHTAANPVNAIDPDGCIIIDQTAGDIETYRNYLKEQITLLKSSGNDDHWNAKIQLRNLMNDLLKELNTLEESETTYIVQRSNDNSGYLDYNTEQGAVIVALGGENIFNISISNGLRAHELHHAYQYEKGKLSIRIDGKRPTLYDITDEVECYNIERAISIGIDFFERPNNLYQGYPNKVGIADVLKMNNGAYKNLPTKGLKITKKLREYIINGNSNKTLEFFKGM